MDIEKLKLGKPTRLDQLNSVLNSRNLEDSDKNASIKLHNSTEELIDFLYEATMLIKMDDTGKVNTKLRALCSARIPSLTSADVIVLLIRMKKSLYPLGEYHSLYRMVENNCDNPNKMALLKMQYDHVKDKR